LTVSKRIKVIINKQNFDPHNTIPRVVILAGSPRRDGNSWRLAESLQKGSEAASCKTDLVYLPDYIEGFLRDCRTCRDSNGNCAIDDNFQDLFVDKVLPADALVFATPIWWYGMSGILKTFFDRMFCYLSLSHSNSEEYSKMIQWKRVALLLSAEESNLSARLAIIQQMQEMTRYLNQSLVGVITGIGNRRGDVDNDPMHSIKAANELGAHLFDIRATDYKLVTDRSGSVWEDGEKFPAYWR
jgi:putative NADPH-quinone reductase